MYLCMWVICFKSTVVNFIFNSLSCKIVYPIVSDASIIKFLIDFSEQKRKQDRNINAFYRFINVMLQHVYFQYQNKRDSMIMVPNTVENEGTKRKSAADFIYR